VKLTINLMELSGLPVANCRYGSAGERGRRAMLEAGVLRSALTAMSTMFGGLGVFFVYMSFLKPTLGVYAVVFLTFALGILHSSTPK
jgi:hypothetical protein